MNPNLDAAGRCYMHLLMRCRFCSDLWDVHRAIYPAGQAVPREHYQCLFDALELGALRARRRRRIRAWILAAAAAALMLASWNAIAPERLVDAASLAAAAIARR